MCGPYILVLCCILGLATSQGPFSQIQLANILQRRNNMLQQSMLRNLQNVQQTTRLRNQSPLMNQLTSNVNRMTRNMFNSVNTGTPTPVDTILRQQRNLQNQLLQDNRNSPNSIVNRPNARTTVTRRNNVNSVRGNQQPTNVVVVTRTEQTANTNQIPDTSSTRVTTSQTSNPFSSSIGNTTFDDIFTNFGGFGFPTTSADFWTGDSVEFTASNQQPPNRDTSPTTVVSRRSQTTFDPATGITFGRGFTSSDSNSGTSSQTSSPIVTDVTPAQMTCSGEYKKMAGHTLCMTDSPDVTRAGVSAEDKQRITQIHNSLRANVQPPAADLMMLQWDDRLAAVAQKWAKQCKLAHDDERSIPDLGMSIGQNVGVGFESWQPAIQMWYDEISLYRYGYDPESYLGPDGWKRIAHFTQIVQNGTYLIGCGYAECPSMPYVRYYVCNYAAGQSNLAYPYTAGSRCEACPNNCNNGLCDCGGLVCLNGGRLDANTCKCECDSLYVGDRCEMLNCPVSDNWICGRDWPPSFCDRYTNVPGECPYMCGICGGGSSGSSSSPAATTNITTFTSSFGCRYTGRRDNEATCKSYGDKGSDMRMCSSEGGTIGCNECEQYFNIKKDYCPVMCGLCDPPCAGKRCSNGGTLDTNTCSCACRKPFTGDTCEFAQCPINGDPRHCSLWPRRYCQEYYNVPEECPYMCNICKAGNPEVSVRGSPINWGQNGN